MPHLIARQHPHSSARRLQIFTNIGILNALLIGCVTIFAHGGGRTVVLAAYGAAVGLGGVLGFLFGIPGPHPAQGDRVQNVAIGGPNSRVLAAGGQQEPPQRTTPNNDAPPTPAAAEVLPSGIANVQNDAPPAAATSTPANGAAPAPDNNLNAALAAAAAAGPAPMAAPAPSNLEQVADWVTKLLLGGGLTQMQRIPPKIWQWSRNIAIGTIGSDGSHKLVMNEQTIQSEQAFAAGILVYGFILGFFSGFLITKLQLGRAVAR